MREMNKTRDAALAGRKVLFLSKSELMDFFGPLLELGKARWHWRIDVLSNSGDGSEYRDLIAPTGSMFFVPDTEKPAAWETDAEIVARTDEQVWRAERATGMPAGRLVLASQRHLGMAYVAAAKDVSMTPLTKKIMMNNEEPFRVVRRLFRFADDMLEASKPDLVLAFEWGKPWRFAVWLAATGRGIPCVAIRRSKIVSDRGFCTADALLFNVAARELALTKRKSCAPISDAARAYTASFRNQPRMVNYIQTNWRRGSFVNGVVFYSRFALGLASDLVRLVTRREARRKSALYSLIRRNRKLVRMRRHQRFFHYFDDAALSAMKYIYFPMHKETDISQTFQAALWHDQRNTVEVLASSLPLGYRLLVKEHRFNYGERPTAYYRFLSRLPNVIFIDAFDSQFKYLRHADLIVTENGSSGWEGLLLGRRVLTLARNFYDGAGLSAKVQDLNEVSAAIVNTLAQPAAVNPDEHDRSLGCMYDAEFETTFPMTREGIPAALDQLALTLSRRFAPIQISRPKTSPAARDEVQTAELDSD